MHLAVTDPPSAHEIQILQEDFSLSQKSASVRQDIHYMAKVMWTVTQKQTRQVTGDATTSHCPGTVPKRTLFIWDSVTPDSTPLEMDRYLNQYRLLLGENRNSDKHQSEPLWVLKHCLLYFCLLTMKPSSESLFCFMR